MTLNGGAGGCDSPIGGGTGSAFSSTNISNNKGMELTAYDEQRQPHLVIDDNTEIVVSPRSLSAELCCPICLDLLANTMTTKECLHRFCQECITTALQRGNKECPTCRKKLISRRSLRPDPNFDALIAKIWPDRREYEQIQERALTRFQTQNGNVALQRSIEEGIRAQAQVRRQRVIGSYDYEKRKRRPKAVVPVAAAGGEVGAVPGAGLGASATKKESTERESSLEAENAHSETSSLSTNGGGAAGMKAELVSQESEEEIEVVLKPHPTVGVVDDTVRYLKTTGNATADHLSKYLSIRIRLAHDAEGNVDKVDSASADEFSIWSSTDEIGHQLSQLNGKTTLRDIATVTPRYSHRSPLQLYFAPKTAVKTDPALEMESS